MVFLNGQQLRKGVNFTLTETTLTLLTTAPATGSTMIIEGF
jgi:hypothetical protein